MSNQRTAPGQRSDTLRTPFPPDGARVVDVGGATGGRTVVVVAGTVAAGPVEVGSEDRNRAVLVVDGGGIVTTAARRSAPMAAR